MAGDFGIPCGYRSAWIGRREGRVAAGRCHNHYLPSRRIQPVRWQSGADQGFDREPGRGCLCPAPDVRSARHAHAAEASLSGMNWWTYLRELHGRLKGDPDGLVWAGWAELVAQTGLQELSDLVEKSFRDGKIEPEFLTRSDFDRILKDAQAGQSHAGHSPRVRSFRRYWSRNSAIGQSVTTSRQGAEDELTLEDEIALGGQGAGDLIARSPADDAQAGIEPVPPRRPQRSMPVRQRQEVQALLRAVKSSG